MRKQIFEAAAQEHILRAISPQKVTKTKRKYQMDIEGKKAAYLRRGEGRTIGTYRSNIASAAESGSDLKEVIKKKIKRKEEVASPRILQSPVLKKDASAPTCSTDSLK